MNYAPAVTVIGMVIVGLLINYWMEKREKKMDELKNKHFKRFSKSKTFEKGSFVLRINYELHENSDLKNLMIVRYFPNSEAKFKKMQLVDSEGELKWVDAKGFAVDESYFRGFKFTLDTRKNELIYKAPTEGCLDELWNDIVKNMNFWKCLDTPFGKSDI